VNFISVIVPVYNDPEGIANTLQSVAAQNYPRYEVIPVDNASTDQTREVIQDWKNQLPELIYPASEHEVQSSYAARNAGVQRARGEIIAFIDADMKAPPTWLQDINTSFSESNIDYLGYEIEVYLNEDKKSVWGFYDKFMGLPSYYHYKKKHFIPTSCLAVRKSVFEKIGVFNSRLISGGDREFGNRVYKHPELTTAFSNDIVVYHPARTTFEAHYNKALRVGRGLALAQEESGSNSDSVFSDLVDHLFPPNPLRIYRRGQNLSVFHFFLLYVMDFLIRYIRLYGAIRYYFEDKLNET
jgi:glycosyltransferase involved in cell wall biosynthesis